MKTRQSLVILLVMILAASTNGMAWAHATPAVPYAPSLPDLDLAYIARLPRYDYDAVKNQPAAGDAVTFEAHVANRGGTATGTFAYRWYVDDVLKSSGTHSSLDTGASATLSLGWTWQTGLHRIRLDLDPLGLISELSEQNNSIEDRTTALAVGFWVEQSVYDYFNLHQVELGLGSVSWEDWAQRQISVWNQMFAAAVHPPLTPQGILDRVRLDKVSVVPDGDLPACATNLPAPDDKTIDLQWGFPAEEVGINSGHVCGAFNYYIDYPDSQNVEYSLMHELSHARYLVDLYGLNEYVNSAYLAASVDAASSSLVLDRDIESDYNFPEPAALALGGELVVCQAKSSNTFSDCARGAEGTTPRPHASGAVVNLGLVRLQDELGNLIMGSPAMPLIGYDDHLYYSRYQDDVMNGGRVYEAYSAYAWNRIAGKRPVCGNYNAPCNIGEYLRDLPQHNILEIHAHNGQPLKGAMLQLHQPHFYPSVYGKLFPREPDAVYFTDALGQVDLGASPFGDLSTEVGPQKGVILLKITSAGQSSYQFFEITRANEAFWMGDHDQATYTITTTLQQGPQPTHAFLPLVFKDYESNPPITLTVPSQPGDGEVGNILCASWDACRNAPEGNLASSIYEAATVAARFEAGTYDVKRVFLTFDTSALPEAATIISAQLHFYAGPFQNGSNLRVHVVQSSQDDALTDDDFSKVGFLSGGSAVLTPDTWLQIPLNPAAWSWIVKGGLTRLALMHDLDLNNLAPTVANDSVIAMSEDTAHQSYLVVQYR